MYEATKSEREILIKDHDYNPKVIDALDAESDKVRQGIPVDLSVAMAVCSYQSDLQPIRKAKRRWWRFSH